jgi:hypothetical protein
VRIDSLKPAPLAALETQEILPVGRQRVPPNTTSLDWGSSALPALELGQEIDAVVLQLLPGDRLLLELGGQQVEAESPSGLSVGQRLLLRVDELQPQLVLHITELEPTIEAEAARLLRTLLPAHADAGALLEHLDSLLQSEESPPIGGALIKLKEAITMLLSDGAPPTPERLKNLFQDGGIYYEAKLLHAAKEDAQSLRAVAGGDLKGLLLSALKETEAGAFPAEFKNAISAQLNNLETQQAVNLLAQLDSGAFQFQIPFFTGAGFSTAALSVERDGKGGKESRDSVTGGYNLLFLLDLENFGRTRIDAHVTEKQLRVIFYVDRESSIMLLRQELPSFRETLLAMGYREVLLAATPLKDIPTEKQQRFDAIAVGAPSSIHLLDVKV